MELEIGYIRYDKDKEASDKHGEEYHPEDHLDIFFDDKLSCKIGINKNKFDSYKDIEKIFTKLFSNKSEKFFLN